MIKKILLLIVLLLVIAYLVTAITAFNSKSDKQTCKNIELIIEDSVNAGFITEHEIASLLKKEGAYPVGKKMDRIQTRKLERMLTRHPLIERAECYKTPGGKICMEISQRLPILRVMNYKGESFYLDNQGKIIPPEANCTAHLAIVTGYAEKSFAMRNLYKFGVFLQNDKFWNAEIEQINVTPTREIELIPRVGDHVVFLGKIDNFEEKLARLKIFYEKALNNVGWNKYERISLEFSNQIICTKKGEACAKIEETNKPAETTSEKKDEKKPPLLEN